MGYFTLSLSEGSQQNKIVVREEYAQLPHNKGGLSIPNLQCGQINPQSALIEPFSGDASKISWAKMSFALPTDPKARM